MFDRLDLFRDDTPSPAPPTPKLAREDQPHDDQVRPGQARPGALGHDHHDREDRARDERAGHRREYDPRRPARRTIADRKRDATADVGMYRAVAYRDLSDKHFDGHPYATRRAVDQMIRAELVKEHDAKGPQGGTYKVLTVTPAGARAAQRAALDAGHAPDQQTWSGMVKPAELSHDVAVYRVAKNEQARIEAEGGRVVRVRIDAELKQHVARATETARAEGGRRAADEARFRAAQDLGLPVTDDHVMYPDAQLDIEDAEGRSGRVNVEIASEHYHAAAITAKAGAGFAVHGSSGRATRNVARALARAIDRSIGGPGGGGAARPGRDGSVEL